MELIIGDMAKIAKGDTFGGRLTQAREEAERWGEVDAYTYTQQELADLLAERFGVAIGRSYLSELERNWQQNKMPSLEVAVALARALRVNLNWLAGLSHVKEMEADADLAWASTTNTIANELDRWPEHARQMMLAAVKAVSPFVKQMAQEKSPDAGISDAEAQGRLNDLLSGSGTNDENGEQPQPRRKRRIAR